MSAQHVTAAPGARRGSLARAAKPWVVALAIPLALILSALLVYQASFAAFSVNTSTAQNNWQTGTVQLTNDKSGQVVFAETNLTPGATGTKDIKVTYTGSVNAVVKTYAQSNGAQDLAPFVNLTITSPGGTNFTGTLADFQTHTNWATGVGSVDMTTPTEDEVYTITWTVAANAPQAKQASVVFMWEAQG